MQERASKKYFELVFYHFEGITYADRHRATAPTYLDSRGNKLITGLYADYLIRIEQCKKMLEAQYGIDFVIKAHPVMKGFNGGISYLIKKAIEYVGHPKKFYVKYKAKRSYIDF